MCKFETKDGRILSAKIKDKEIINLLNNIIPRLTYDEILDGRLEEKLKEYDIPSLKLAETDDIKTLILSLAMFNNLSKPTGV